MLSNRHFKTHDSIFKLKNKAKIQKSGLYEAWYTMLNDTGSGQGFWIRYTLLIPKQRTDQKIEGQALIWFGFSNLSDTTKNFMIKKFYPIEEVVETTSNHIIKISESFLTLTHLQGQFTVDNGYSVSWDLSLSQLKEPYISTPSIYKKLRLTNTLNFGTHPNVQLDGEIRINNTNIPIVAARGLQYHTFGDAYTIPWEWFQAHTFSHHPEAFVDFGYKINKGVLEYFNGKKRVSKWNNNFMSKLRMIKRLQREFSVTSLTFSAKHKDIQIEGEVSTPKDRILGVEYLGPLNEHFYCYNTSLADLEIKVQEGTNTNHYSILGSVAFETVHKKPIEGLPYLSWEAEFM